MTDIIELAYGLLWSASCDRSTHDGHAVYLARKALLEHLDKDGQARGITAARDAMAKNPPFCIICANGNDLPEGANCPSCRRTGPAIHDHGLRLRDVKNSEVRSAISPAERPHVEKTGEVQS